MTEMNNTCCALMKPLSIMECLTVTDAGCALSLTAKYRTAKKLSVSIGKTENKTLNIRERKRTNTCCMWNRTVIWFRCNARSIKW